MTSHGAATAAAFMPYPRSAPETTGELLGAPSVKVYRPKPVAQFLRQLPVDARHDAVNSLCMLGMDAFFTSGLLNHESWAALRSGSSDRALGNLALLARDAEPHLGAHYRAVGGGGVGGGFTANGIRNDGDGDESDDDRYARRASGAGGVDPRVSPRSQRHHHHHHHHHEDRDRTWRSISATATAPLLGAAITTSPSRTAGRKFISPPKPDQSQARRVEGRKHVSPPRPLLPPQLVRPATTINVGATEVATAVAAGGGAGAGAGGRDVPSRGVDAFVRAVSPRRGSASRSSLAAARSAPQRDAWRESAATLRVPSSSANVASARTAAAATVRYADPSALVGLGLDDDGSGTVSGESTRNAALIRALAAQMRADAAAMLNAASRIDSASRRGPALGIARGAGGGVATTAAGAHPSVAASTASSRQRAVAASAGNQLRRAVAETAAAAVVATAQRHGQRIRGAPEPSARPRNASAVRSVNGAARERDASVVRSPQSRRNTVPLQDFIASQRQRLQAQRELGAPVDVTSVRAPVVARPSFAAMRQHDGPSAADSSLASVAPLSEAHGTVMSPPASRLQRTRAIAVRIDDETGALEHVGVGGQPTTPHSDGSEELARAASVHATPAQHTRGSSFHSEFSTANDSRHLDPLPAAVVGASGRAGGAGGGALMSPDRDASASGRRLRYAAPPTALDAVFEDAHLSGARRSVRGFGGSGSGSGMMHHNFGGVFGSGTPPLRPASAPATLPPRDRRAQQGVDLALGELPRLVPPRTPTDATLAQ
jgi:hypothetical protein